MPKLHRRTRRIELKEAQALVDGYVQVIKVGPDLKLLVNEEGGMIGLDWNEEASQEAGQRIVGDAVLLIGPSAARSWG